MDKIEPRMEEELRLRKRPLSSGELLSDSSSSSASDFRYQAGRNLMSSPLKDHTIFSDQLGPRSGASTGHRKRTYHNTLELPTSSAASRKRFRSSPIGERELPSARNAWRNHQLTQSSPIKPRKHSHFTTSNGPSLSFYSGTSESPDDMSENFAATSDDEENTLPAHSFNMRSSPPRTPPPARNRSVGRRNKEKNGKSEEGADLLLYLATSPSPVKLGSRGRMQAPSTPPPRHMALPSSMMTTPGGGGLTPLYGNPQTPSQMFDFSDFVNITPSPAQTAWPKTPRTVQTPATVTRRRLNYDNFATGSSSPLMAKSASKHNSHGMQLGGDLM